MKFPFNILGIVYHKVLIDDIHFNDFSTKISSKRMSVIFAGLKEVKCYADRTEISSLVRKLSQFA